MTQAKMLSRSGPTARLVAAALIAVPGFGAAIAHGQTDGGTAAGETEETGAEGGRVKVVLERAKPRKTWLSGKNSILRYETERATADLKIKVIRRSNGKVVRTYKRRDVPPGERQRLEWNGKGRKRDGKREFVRQGRYRFRISNFDGELRDRRARGRRGSGFYRHKFPVRGRHDYWDGFGAGRGHKGQDVGTRCGTKIAAARGGRVQWKAYQGGGAGHYLVIDGRGTKKDYVYMHLKRRSPRKRGERVRTGQKIGRVGATGNASGCHLHFELWKGDWWNGGRPMRRVTRAMKRWDSWS